MNENIENMELLDLEELDEISGGKKIPEGDGGKGAIMVINKAGANIRRAKNSKSKRIGRHTCGAILYGAKNVGKGPDGYNWYHIPSQGGQAQGYIAVHLTKKC